MHAMVYTAHISHIIDSKSFVVFDTIRECNAIFVGNSFSSFILHTHKTQNDLEPVRFTNFEALDPKYGDPHICFSLLHFILLRKVAFTC